MEPNTITTITKSVNREATVFFKDITAGSAVLREKLFGEMPDKLMFSAIIEAHALGFTAQDFLAKKVYAIPYGNKYSLVTSIDDSRSKAAATGDYAGSDGAVFTYNDNGKIDTCSVTVKKFVKGLICEFTATVYFDEYSTGRNLWATKPRTMIAKVAEMHALRKAFPDTVKLYDEAEMPTGTSNVIIQEADPTDDIVVATETKEEEPVMSVDGLNFEEIQ